MPVGWFPASNTLLILAYTEAIPCTLLDIWNADQTHGWGVFARQGQTQYYSTAVLKTGDGINASWLADEGQSLQFANDLDITWSRFCISGETNSHIRFGKLVDESKKITSLGCRINFGNNTACIGRNGALTNIAPDVKLYSTTLTGTSNAVQNMMAMNGYVYNLIGERILFYKSNMAFYNVYVSQPATQLNLWAYPEGTFDRIDLHNYDYPIYLGSVGVGTRTFKNITLKGNTYVARFEGSSYTLNLVNADADNWALLWQGGSSSARLNRQYEFDAKVIEEDSSRTPISGATVKVWDLGSNLVTNTTTDASGDITQQTLNFGYYRQSTGNTPTMQTPHKIEVSKAGYETLVKYMYMDYPRKEVVMLRKSRPVKLCDDRLVLQVCSESEKEDRFIYTELV